MHQLFLKLILCNLLFSVSVLAAREHIIVSGGPALRYFEKYKKENTHDRYWGNFIDAPIARLPQIRAQMQPNDQLTWLVFRPAYITRGLENQSDLISAVKKKLSDQGMKPYWFNSRKELIHYLNKGVNRKELPIARVEYFGHSNKRTWMFDYSNNLDGAVAEPLLLHISHIKEIKRSAFAEDAISKSWGCHSGEAFTLAWQKHTKTPMKGAVGKTDYSNGGIPFISTPEGYWTFGEE
ncbi:MAG: hypothetical protein AAGA18_02175 [Verrucomicrobiota bacterium]